MRRHPSPFSAFTMLVLHSERKLTLTESQFDDYFDEVLSALERANNEKYRLHQDPERVNHESEE